MTNNNCLALPKTFLRWTALNLSTRPQFPLHARKNDNTRQDPRNPHGPIAGIV
jgi:hypothetical protein